MGKKDEPQPTQQYDQQQHPITSTATNQQPQEQKLAPAEQAQKVVDQLNKAKKNYQQGLQGYMALVAMYVVLVLGYIAINAFNGWSRLTRWIGILAVSIGVLPFMIAAGTRTAVEQAILNMHFDSGVPMAIQQAAPLAARDVQHVLFFSMTIISGLIVLLGIAAIIWAHFMAKPEVKKK